MQWIQEGISLTGTDHKTFWIDVSHPERVGLIRLYDLDDVAMMATPSLTYAFEPHTEGRALAIRQSSGLTRYLFDTGLS